MLRDCVRTVSGVIGERTSDRGSSHRRLAGSNLWPTDVRPRTICWGRHLVWIQESYDVSYDHMLPCLCSWCENGLTALVRNAGA